MPLGFQVTFDAAEPQQLADFWALALDFQPQPPPPGFDSWEAFGESLGMADQVSDFGAVVDPDSGRRLLFRRVPEGKTAKNRVHLDVNVSADMPEGADRRAVVTDHVRRLLDAGATFLREVDEPTGYCQVLQDPEGNEFCVQ